MADACRRRSSEQSRVAAGGEHCGVCTQLDELVAEAKPAADDQIARFEKPFQPGALDPAQTATLTQRRRFTPQGGHDRGAAAITARMKHARPRMGRARKSVV